MKDYLEYIFKRYASSEGCPLSENKKVKKKVIFPRYLVVFAAYSSFFSSSCASFCGAGGIPPSALQHFEANCAKPRFSSPVHLQRRFTSDGVIDLY
jgi:hypothetical protein